MRIIEKTTTKIVQLDLDEYLELHDLCVRYRVLDKHQRCFYCGCGTKTQSERIMDHVIPKSLGGKNFIVNACQSCNQAKGSLLPEQFRELRYGKKKIEFYGETIIRQSRGTK